MRASSRRRQAGRASTALCGCLALLGGAAPGALALYGPSAGGQGADIVSVDNARREQGDGPTFSSAVSANGRYVVFATRATNFFADNDPDQAGTTRVGGVFRYDRQTGALDLVADGDEVRTSDGSLVFRGAANPSVSADGRFVAFSTDQKLVAADTNDNVDVYVRDMNVSLSANRSAGGAYRLVSAPTGAQAPPAYAAPASAQTGNNPGSDVWPGTSISQDGSRVVFRTTQTSSGLPDPSAANVPAGQVLVRDLSTHTSTLVTRNANSTSPGGDPAGGATGPAVISGDGSTVVWTGANAPAQTRFLAGESLDPSHDYYLWRRWRDPGAPTRRPIGVSDPDDGACPPDGSVTGNTAQTGPCYGPLTDTEQGLSDIASTVPALSADGRRVAVLVSGGPRPTDKSGSGLDLWVTDMSPGVSRKAGSRELTRQGAPGDPTAQPPIDSVAMSGNGNVLAFTTERTHFVLPYPAPVGSFRAAPQYRDLYAVDLGASTLERALIGSDGGDSNDSTFNGPTLSSDGAVIGFVSAASNLFFGDANGQADAFTLSRAVPGGTAAAPAGANRRPSGFALSGGTGSPDLLVQVRRGRDGSVVLVVDTPAAGRVVARASGQIAVGASKGRARGHGGRGRARRPKKRAATLAQASASASGAGPTTLVLRLAPRYRKLGALRRIPARVSVDFTPAARGQSITTEVSVTFALARKRSSRHTAKRHSKHP